MMCDECQGSGFKPICVHMLYGVGTEVVKVVTRYEVCPECFGSGVVSCCEGAERFGQIGDSSWGR